MSEDLTKALQYIFMQNYIALKESKFKGLRYSQAFNFDKSVRQMATAISRNEIKDLEEVLSYGG